MFHQSKEQRDTQEKRHPNHNDCPDLVALIEKVIKEYDKLRGTKQFATYNGKQMDFEMYRAVRFQEGMSNQGEI